MVFMHSFLLRMLCAFRSISVLISSSSYTSLDDCVDRAVAGVASRQTSVYTHDTHLQQFEQSLRNHSEITQIVCRIPSTTNFTWSHLLHITLPEEDPKERRIRTSALVRYMVTAVPSRSRKAATAGGGNTAYIHMYAPWWGRKLFPTTWISPSARLFRHPSVFPCLLSPRGLYCISRRHRRRTMHTVRRGCNFALLYLHYCVQRNE